MRTFSLILLFAFVSIIFQPQAGAAIDEKLLKEAKLHTAWQSATALNPSEKVQRMTVLGDYIYILTDSNYLFCLNRNDGQPVFSISAAEKNLPVSEPADFNNTVYFIAANYLIAIDLQSGAEIDRKKLNFPVTEKPAINGSSFYFAGTDSFLHVTNKDMFEIFKVNPDDKSDISSVIANEDSVIFSTVSGKVYSMDANQAVRHWRFDTVGKLEAPLTKTNGSIYVSGKDTNLYKLNAKDGELVWKFYTGCFLDASARATETTVYQNAPNKGLYAIDANSGKQLWLLPDGVDLLAENGGTAYVFDKNRVCVVMDNAQAKKIYTINFATVTSFATNPYDAKIYIMEGKNISCVEPIKR